MTGAISGSQLVELFLTRNPTITIRGWERLSTLLEMPDSKLEKLYLSGNNIGDEVARIFANALRGNSKLKCLTVNNCRFTTEGWMHFSKLLCDTSSLNKTYLSNHTLRVLALSDHRELPTDLVSLLNLNAISENKGQVAMTKILQHHSHFNMQPFFEWEFKVACQLYFPGWKRLLLAHHLLGRKSDEQSSQLHMILCGNFHVVH